MGRLVYVAMLTVRMAIGYNNANGNFIWNVTIQVF